MFKSNEAVLPIANPVMIALIDTAKQELANSPDLFTVELSDGFGNRVKLTKNLNNRISHQDEPNFNHR
jgi:hypothetical protein